MSNYLYQMHVPTLKLFLLINKKVTPYEFPSRYVSILTECIVCAESEEEAYKQHPANCDGTANVTINVFPEKQQTVRSMFDFNDQLNKFELTTDMKRECVDSLNSPYYDWVINKEDIEVVYLGNAKLGMRPGVVLAHWNKL